MTARERRAACIALSFPNGFTSKAEETECENWINAAPAENKDLEYAYRSPSIGDYA